MFLPVRSPAPPFLVSTFSTFFTSTQLTLSCRIPLASTLLGLFISPHQSPIHFKSIIEISEHKKYSPFLRGSVPQIVEVSLKHSHFSFPSPCTANYLEINTNCPPQLQSGPAQLHIWFKCTSCIHVHASALHGVDYDALVAVHWVSDHLPILIDLSSGFHRAGKGIK